MAEYAPFPLIDLSGSPRERGRTHGKEGHLEACPMPSLNRRFTTYSLTPDRTAQRQAAD